MITKNYIKMCEGAEEIQKAWKPKQFDCYYAKLLERNFVLAELSSVNVIEKYIYNYVYLPTQEQLQEMVLKDIDDLEVSFTNKDTPAIEANIWLKKDGKWDGFQPLFADDWNILWLQIYMLMKCSKIWTGKKWVKYENNSS